MQLHQAAACLISPKAPSKGRLTLPKWMNFLKSSKRPLTPPHFRKIILTVLARLAGLAGLAGLTVLARLDWLY